MVKLQNTRTCLPDDDIHDQAIPHKSHYTHDAVQRDHCDLNSGRQKAILFVQSAHISTQNGVIEQMKRYLISNTLQAVG